MPIIVKSKLQKHGGGAQIYIPQDVLTTSNLETDKEVELDVTPEGGVIIKNITPS